MGVVFVGHGLSKDFRVINLVLAQDQVIDTVDIFYLPYGNVAKLLPGLWCPWSNLLFPLCHNSAILHGRDQRRISLRFLAWYFLNLQMQHEDVEGHDSVEDATTALRVSTELCFIATYHLTLLHFPAPPCTYFNVLPLAL